MSVSEVIGMKAFLFGGGVVAALFTTCAAIAQTQTPPAPARRASLVRRSFFTSNEARSDVSAHVEKMFKQLDLNHDGFVTRDEVATSKARFDERTSKSAPKRAEKAFDRLDTNHDGQVTGSELDAARSARLAAHGKHPGRGHGASSLFKNADANKDGIVTRAEYLAAVATGKIKARHANMRGSAIARLFDKADADKNGRLSLEEARQASLQQFDAADLNHDGILTPDERRQASRSERAKRSAA
jgi:Ca2+-binding EF-hand superfamily protein